MSSTAQSNVVGSDNNANGEDEKKRGLKRKSEDIADSSAVVGNADEHDSKEEFYAFMQKRLEEYKNKAHVRSSMNL
jgi:hypothetical protein